MIEITSQIQALQEKLSKTYLGIDQDNAYKIHSVLVHDGLAGVGHYWTFVKDHTTGKWTKFNDTMVTEVDEATVFKESEGGHMNMSAYCLFYVSGMLFAITSS